MPERRPTMDDLDLKEFALAVAGGWAAVGGLIWLVALLLPWPVALVIVIAMPVAAVRLMMRLVDWWWRAHSADDGEVSDA
jgi:hypothetical protein